MSLGSSRALHEKFNFIVLVDGIEKLFFSKTSEVSHEVARIDYHEGGALLPIKWPGRVTVPDITLERGVGTSRSLHDWFVQVANLKLDAGRGAGFPVPAFIRNVTIVQRDRPRTGTLRKWRLFGCFPVKYMAGDWDNGVDAVVIESLTLAYDRPELIAA
jgi:phage tail-like protein